MAEGREARAGSQWQLGIRTEVRVYLRKQCTEIHAINTRSCICLTARSCEELPKFEFFLWATRLAISSTVPVPHTIPHCTRHTVATEEAHDAGSRNTCDIKPKLNLSYSENMRITNEIRFFF